MAFGVYTGFRVTSQCFQYFPCPQSPEVLKAGQGEVLKALQDTFTPYIFSSFVGWLQLETTRAQIGWQNGNRIWGYLAMLTVPSKTWKC
ncbi:unnamed protein product [Sphagnum troendelagicum]|uniref:Uncharacterized protein n=1 Tax=Sphagnum troendelagicum TaxID=128251 RepID=A0ABP0TYG0_9BRYO